MHTITPSPWRWMAADVGPRDPEWGFRTPGEIDPRQFRSTDYSSNPELVGAVNDDWGNPVVVLSAGGGEYCPFKNGADAQLIAAAPELLAALQNARTWLYVCAEQAPYPVSSFLREACATADAAIAKAIGQPKEQP